MNDNRNGAYLGLSSDVFETLREDFDEVLAMTLSNMETKGSDNAVITLKLCVSLENRVFEENGAVRKSTKPSFDHDVRSTVQVKSRKFGSADGEYELEFDADREKYVLRKLNNGQMTLFDE